MIRIPFIWLRKNWPRLAVVALALPCAVSCATIREDVDEEDDTPLTFEERLMNREGKKFDKKTLTRTPGILVRRSTATKPPAFAASDSMRSRR